MLKAVGLFREDLLPITKASFPINPSTITVTFKVELKESK